jgi:hypothetical protein
MHARRWCAHRSHPRADRPAIDHRMARNPSGAPGARTRSRRVWAETDPVHCRAEDSLSPRTSAVRAVAGHDVRSSPARPFPGHECARTVFPVEFTSSRLLPGAQALNLPQVEPWLARRATLDRRIRRLGARRSRSRTAQDNHPRATPRAATTAESMSGHNAVNAFTIELH